MRRWMWWLLPPWDTKIRRRQALAVMRAWQEEERRAARTRIGGVARILDEPTRVLPVVVRPPAPGERTPLTRGQTARTRQGDHW